MSKRTASALAAALLFSLPAAARSQTAQVTAEEENLRLEPLGKVLATVNRGTRVDVRGREGRWRQVALSGWIWTPSVGSTDRQGYDLVVTADGGENLRRSPGPEADIAAWLLEGFLLQRLEEKGNWTRVRRTAWMWAPSLAAASGGSPADGGSPARAESGGGDATGAGSGRPSGASGGPDRLAVEERPASLFVSPDGDTLAVARPGAALSVLAREGEWARVRLEGWVRVDRVVSSDSVSATGDLEIGDLKANPDQYRGRRVRWTLQFISLERAEPERTDFHEGEPFMLARPVDGESGFVYVAVPPERVSRVEKLEPLQRIRVTGRIRTGQSALMGAPVLDLVELVPIAPEEGGGG